MLLDPPARRTPASSTEPPDALDALGYRIEWTPAGAGRATSIDVIVDEV